MTIIILIATIITIFIILEAGMYCLTHFPTVLRLLPRKLQNSIGYLYIQGDRKIIQYQDGCGQHSPDLGYTLKPGEFVFTEIEYSNKYRINTLGVRDSEESLTAPEIVFLGDSYTLGWGVDQAETFVKQLENRIKRKTLNTAIPSYGTVREMLMLRKVDRSQLKCLIIQYCSDDYDENRLFFVNGNRPQIMRAATFNNLAVQHSKSKSYFPGKYIGLKIKKRRDEWKLKQEKKTNDNYLNDVDLFIHVLKQNTDILASLPIIVFEMNGINQTNRFTNELRGKAAKPDQPLFIRNMIILDMSQYLQDRNFYVLDSHLTATGHVIVADVLYKTILQINIFKKFSADYSENKLTN
ncbi:MAG: hypothetical protein CVU62_02655 [Deltaproteobacteria bacterium HGW-Deltaproteobacteria-2]|jgi:hypothetical protein|nr:MAG: hypothetical protein CVU62_02655 [Deltaproteobacteria bacterium HGW-Deltaproteobacteria-2]